MSNGDRLGILGLILACTGIGIATLWPTAGLIGWAAIIVAIALVTFWGILELKHPQQLPSFVFVFGAPLGDNNSPVWVMMFKHFGPCPAYNCDVEFFDQDRKNIEHEWLVQHPDSPYPPPELAGISQSRTRIPEAGLQGDLGNFQWAPVDSDRQHYTASISCRDGIFVEHWEVTRVDGVLRSKIRIERGPEWIRKHPKLDPIIFEYEDAEFSSAPLARALPKARRDAMHPGWKPNYTFQVPVAIIDPNGHVQVMSGVKLPDGNIRTDFGCWNVLTKHFGDESPSRAYLLLQRIIGYRPRLT